MKLEKTDSIDYYRESDSNAILNNNNQALAAYKKRKQLHKNIKLLMEEHKVLEKRVRILEHENNELKNILGVEKV